MTGERIVPCKICGRDGSNCPVYVDGKAVGTVALCKGCKNEVHRNISLLPPKN